MHLHLAKAAAPPSQSQAPRSSGVSERNASQTSNVLLPHMNCSQLIKSLQPTARSSSITSICVFGERHSGTNFVASLLRENVAPVKTSGWRGRPQQSVGFGCSRHKHKDQNRASGNFDPSSVLAVGVVRNPYDYALSMFRFPWSTSSPQRQNPNWIHLARDPQGLTDPHMTRTIQTRKESAYRVFARFTASRWSPQRDTLVESAHDSLGAMRTSKLANMLLLPWPNLEIVRYECLLPVPPRIVAWSLSPSRLHAFSDLKSCEWTCHHL
ncbi:hypothetical protein CYMTET_24257 [Cymbomonas tetramitiformis]|uniref:Sulfotransferase n=1 Tax=Cymbomonas tetramitiformis TaxID=36881 RepID=A0AAE0L0F8_9CHLO|nr:hypothetical protein CYMTET_24257 [Cymbomonas tetramitiformis]